MKNKFKERYRRMIFDDIKNPRNRTLKKIFPWILVGFFVLQVIYYFLYFHTIVWKRIFFLMYYHHHLVLNLKPKSLMFTYDYLLNFILYLFFVFLFCILGFMAFDASQRNEIIRQLSKDRDDIKIDEDEKS